MAGRAAIGVASALAWIALPSALSAQTSGIDCNLLGPNAVCPPNLLYPPGQDLRLTVPTRSDKDPPAIAGSINTLRELFAALRSCWRPPASDRAEQGMEIAVRVSFNRNGYVIGTPRFTFTSPQVSERTRKVYRQAVIDSLEHCEPLPVTKGLGGAMAGRPIAIRYIDNRNIPKIGA
jgi:hypothetical protein